MDGDCTPLSPWIIILDKHSFVKLSHHYITSGGYHVCLQPMPCGLNGMYWAICEQSNCDTSLTPLYSHCYGHDMSFAWVIWGGEFFSRKYFRRSHKCYYFPYKQVSGRNGDHEWLRMTNAFILCDLLWKVQKSHEVNKEGSFKYYCCQQN